VILIRDPRLPISPTAARTRRLLSGLIEKKAPLYEPPVEALAGLKALRQLMSETRAGDLAHHGEAVPEEAVREWLVRNLDPALKGLFEDMIHQTQERLGDDAELWQDLAALLDEVMVAPLDEVQKRLGLGSLERLEDIIRRRPDRIGWLQGPPALLFSFVPADVLNVPTGGEPL
jgi:hypothetical protein